MLPVFRCCSLWYFLSGLALLAGCTPRQGREAVHERPLMHTGFEELADWSLDSVPSLSTERAHSGRYALRTDAAHPYSANYHAELGKLCSQRVRRLTFSAWVWVTGAQDSPLLVVAIDNPGNPPETVLNKPLYINEFGFNQRWTKVSRSFDVPETIHANSRLVLYLWQSNAAQPVFTDDWELTALR